MGPRRGRRALRRGRGLLERHLWDLHDGPRRDLLHRHGPAQRLRPRLPRAGLRERPLVLLRPRQPRALQARGDREARARGDCRRRQRRAVLGPRARRHQVRRGLPHRFLLPHAYDLLLRRVLHGLWAVKRKELSLPGAGLRLRKVDFLLRFRPGVRGSLGPVGA